MPKSIDKYIILITIMLAAALPFFNKQYKNLFYGDAMGYYTYLPQAFIVGNFQETKECKDWEKLPETRKQIRNYFSPGEALANGNYIIQYTYGVALFEAPFFFLAHTYEKLIQLPANGFSSSYTFAIRASSVFYALLGLYILFLCLKKYFDSTSSLISLSVIVLGTNFLWFAVAQGGMAHIIIFFLVACLIFISIKIQEAPQTKWFVLLGLTIGAIALVRPTDVLFATIPILYGIDGWQGLKNKLMFIWKHKLKILLAILVAALPLIPQLLYWKSLTGSYFFYSYGNQEFHWRHPHIKEGLFSASNGWLVYTPVMAVSIFGLIFIRKIKSFFLIIFLTLPLYVYIIYAWYCFNYINGLGSRPMIHYYPLLAWPLAALIQFFSNKKWYLKIPFAALLVLLSSISYSFCFQQIRGTLWSENTNFNFLKSTLYRYPTTYNDLVCADNGIVQPMADKMTFLKTIQTYQYESDTNSHVKYDKLKKSKVYHLQPGEEYPEHPLEVPFNKNEHGNAQWIKCSGQFFAPSFCGYYINSNIVLEIKRGNENIFWASCVINNKIGLNDQAMPKDGFTLFQDCTGKWGSVSFFAPMPTNIQDGDNIRMIVWSIGKCELLVDDLKMELYK